MFNSTKLRSCLFLSALLFFAFYLGMAYYPLADNNEGMYAEIAREMLATKQFIIPHLNYLPYLEKPPLFYWLMAASMQIFGPTTFAARLIPTTAALLTCLSLLFWGYKSNRYAVGWVAALILASSFGFVVIGRIVFFDMLLTFWLTQCLLFFYLWLHSKANGYLYAAYAFLALAILTKGIVALVLALPIALSYLLWLRSDFKTVLRFFNPLAILLFFAIVIPWHVLAQLQWPDFLHYYFINEQWLRFLDKRVPHDYYTGPIYYYLPRLLIYLLPWTLVLIGWIFYQKKSITDSQVETPYPPLKPFLYLWFLIPLLFFSLSRAKANYYMVVGLPPLALLLGYWIVSRSQQNNLVLYIASFVFPGMLVALWGLHHYQDNFSKRNLVNYFLEHHPQQQLFLYQDYEKFSSIAFYMRQRLVVVDSKSKDLWYGQQNAPNSPWFMTTQQFLQNVNAKYIVVLDYRKEAFIAATQAKPWCEEITFGNASLFSRSCVIPRLVRGV